MKAIQALQEATNQLIELLQQEELDRDVRIEKIQSLLDQREELLKSIQPPFSQQEKELGKQLVELDQQVKQLLQKQKQDIQKRSQTAPYEKRIEPKIYESL